MSTRLSHRLWVLPFLALATIGLGGTRAPAAPAPSFVLVQAERKGPSGLEQTTLIFEAERVRYVTNSNFLQAEPQRAVLGQFEAKYNPALEKARKVLQTERAAVENKDTANETSGAKPYVSPHEIQVYVGTTKVPLTSATYMKLMEVLVASPRLAKWTAKEGAEITYRYGTKASLQEYVPGATAAKSAKRTLTCEAPGSDLVCKTDRFGQAWFKRVPAGKSP